MPVFIVTLFIIAKMWKQTECPLIGEWISKMQYSAILFSFKKGKSFAIYYNMNES